MSGPTGVGAMVRMTVILEAALLVLAIGLMRLTGVWPSLGLAPAGLLGGALLGLVLAAVAIALVRSRVEWLEGARRDFAKAIALFSGISVPGIAIVAVSAGIAEEALFRGFAQSWLAARVDVHVAVIATAVIFGLAHAISVRYAVFAAVLGAVLGYLFVLTGSLASVALSHAVYDFVVLLWGTRAFGDRGASTHL
jgi:uncharacterized protein